MVALCGKNRKVLAQLEAKKSSGKSFIYHEVELVYRPMYRLEETSGRIEHYRAVHAALRARYDEVSAGEMKSMLTFLAHGAGSPIMAGLLALNFHSDATQRGGSPLPRSVVDLFESAVHEFLAFKLGEDEAHSAHQLLFFVAQV